MSYTGYGNSGFDIDTTRQVSSFDQNFTGASGAYDNYFESTHAYDEILETHPKGHLQLTQKDTSAEDHHNRTSNDALDFLNNASKNVGSFVGNEKEIVSENLAQHKYSILSNSSYDYFNSRGSHDEVHAGLTDSNYSYIDDLKNFKVDEDLSTIDDLVLHNTNTGETHISYRGTTDNPSRVKNFLNDWKVNGEIAGGSTHSTRIKNANQQIENVFEKYGKDKVSVSGHSQGGHVSYQMAVEHDLPGHHFNPAINLKQLKDTEKYGESTLKQNIYKTPMDFASPVAYNKKLGNINIVNNLENMDGVVQTHSIDQFAPKPSSISGELAQVERRTLAGSIFKGAGAVVGTGLTAYQLGTDIKDDLAQDKSVAEESVDISIDTAKVAEQYVVDGEIIGTSLALAPETMGASLVIGLGAVMINDMLSNHLAEDMKDEVPKVGNALKKTGKKIGNFFKGLF